MKRCRYLRALIASFRHRFTCRRMRASIAAGRVLAVAELSKAGPSSDPGIDNHIPPINRLAAWWGRAREARFLEGRSAAQLEALLRDFAPVEEMVAEIRAALAGRRVGGRSRSMFDFLLAGTTDVPGSRVRCPS